jgi:hypothetical protein
MTDAHEEQAMTTHYWHFVQVDKHGTAQAQGTEATL